ncbi:MAG: DNA polymerase III subunit beta [Clostridia bacterium]|nr:DNA polymerase III subunit beta [Clostridia bacterium]
MKFSCDKALLSEVVSNVQKSVSTRSNVPVLEGILLEAGADGMLKLFGNDLDLAMESYMPASVTEPGSVVINARFFGDVIRKMEDGVFYFQADQDCNIQIKCGTAEFSVMGISAHEFPEIAAVEEKDSFSIPDKLLKNMIKNTIYAVCLDENKVALTGSLFEIEEGILSIVSVDGYRLALRREKLESPCRDQSFIIPSKVLNEVMKILKDSDHQVKIGISENKVQFEIENYKLISRLLEGEFLNYKQILPAQNKLKVTANVRKLSDCMERAALMIANDSTKYPVRLSIKTDQIQVSCVSRFGKMMDTASAVTQGEDLEIGFNYRYLLDALKACECETVLIELNTPHSPCIIKPETGDQFVYLVLPVKMKD